MIAPMPPCSGTTPTTARARPSGRIVVRHTDLLYAAALRQVGCPDLARAVLQNVFTNLGRKARELA